MCPTHVVGNGYSPKLAQQWAAQQTLGVIMASITTLVDDVDGRTKLPADSSSTRIQFTDSRGSFHVDIDLADKNFRPIWEALQVVRDNGREVIAPPVVASKSGKDSESDGPVIRAWAQANPDLLPEGVKVPEDKGALSKAVVAAYDAFKMSDRKVPTTNPADDDGTETEVK